MRNKCARRYQTNVFSMPRFRPARVLFSPASWPEQQGRARAGRAFTDYIRTMHSVGRWRLGLGPGGGANIFQHFASISAITVL